MTGQHGNKSAEKLARQKAEAKHAKYGRTAGDPQRSIHRRPINETASRYALPTYSSGSDVLQNDISAYIQFTLANRILDKLRYGDVNTIIV